MIRTAMKIGHVSARVRPTFNLAGAGGFSGRGRTTLRLLTAASWLLVLAVSARAARSQPAPPNAKNDAFFENSIRPLLAARCHECHGPGKQEGGLRLDGRSGLERGSDSGPVVEPGKPEESRLVEVVSYADSVKMPPKQQLPQAEIDLLKEWIRRGAPFPENESGPAGPAPASPPGIALARATHWAYQPIRRPEPPSIAGDDWSQTPIDRFVALALASAGLKPSPPADKRTLLRRATFDLIGLPPAPQDVEAFERDLAPDAFARVVDRLLASPHYGERWGRHWLDVARYADTKGYVFTEERKYPFSYTYRDYVIRALNRDVPYDQFIVEQIAADLLPERDEPATLAAMGFLTLGRRFGNNLHDIIDDRIDLVTRGLMGLTVQCARCHDHKYDAIPTEDYYALYGVFANSIEPADLPQIGQPELNEAYAAYQAELEKRETALRATTEAKLAELLDEFRAATPAYLAAALTPRRERGAGRGAGLSLGPGELRPAIVERWRAYLNDSQRRAARVFDPWVELARLPADQFEQMAPDILARYQSGQDTAVNPLVAEALREAAPRTMADVAAAYGKLFARIQADWVALRGPAAVPAMNEAGAPSRPAPAALPDANAEELRQVLYAEQGPLAVRGEEARRLFDRATRNQLTELRRAVETWKANSTAAPPRAMVLNDVASPVNPRVFIRGNPNRPGKEVSPGFPRVVAERGAAAFQQGSGRLELARAIASPANPLTPRVMANRVWMLHMGRGLVETPADFGARGLPPSHPELLDWLARRLIDSGWSLKELHRAIMLSSTYQQSSLERHDAATIDPENRLYWRMNRRRLEFEALRDSLLLVAGRLDCTMQGRPVDLFAEPLTTRRAVYGFIDRQDLPGTLRVFDFANPDVSTAARPQTTVPQQALFSMNSRQCLEAASHLARRAETLSGGADASSVARMLFRLAWQREPGQLELQAAVRYLATAGQTEAAAAPAAVDQLAHALLLANEFLFID